jgi:hypothetical protein
MKRAKCQRRAGPEEERTDSFELAENIYCTDGMTSISSCVNIRYRLRSRTIFDCKIHETHTLENNVPVVQESALVKTNYSARNKYSFRNIPKEDIAGELSTKLDTFNQKKQTSKDITHSISDRFTSDPSIMMLPNEVLTMIFSYLNVRDLSTSVAPVCKHWYLIAHSPVLWRKLCFDGDRVSTEFAKNLLTKSPYLSELIISNR